MQPNPPVWPLTRLRCPDLAPTDTEGGRRVAALDQGIGLPDVKVSYLTVVKNRCDLLKRTIDSVARQKQASIEHIIVDGASSDGTVDYLLAQTAVVDYFISRPDDGLYDAINKGIELCRGSYICILNSDDWLTKGAVRTVLRDLSAETAPCIHAYSAWKVAPGKKSKLWSPSVPRLGDYLRCADLCHNALYVPKRVYAVVGMYDSSYGIAADFKWMMQAVESRIPFRPHLYPVTNYSTTGVSSHGGAHWQECYRLIGERFPFLDGTDIFKLLNFFYRFKENRPSGAISTVSINELLDEFGSSALMPVLADALASMKEHASPSIAQRVSLRIRKSYWRAIKR